MRYWGLGLALAFWCALAFAVWMAAVPPAIAAVYVVASIVSLAMYALDKAAARANRWRTRESTLHLLSLMGGWPGALMAQSLLRHKTQKSAFLAVFYVTVLLNCALFGWLLRGGALPDQ